MVSCRARSSIELFRRGSGVAGHGDGAVWHRGVWRCLVRRSPVTHGKARASLRRSNAVTGMPVRLWRTAPRARWCYARLCVARLRGVRSGTVMQGLSSESNAASGLSVRFRHAAQSGLGTVQYREVQYGGVSQGLVGQSDVMQGLPLGSNAASGIAGSTPARGTVMVWCGMAGHCGPQKGAAWNGTAGHRGAWQGKVKQGKGSLRRAMPRVVCRFDSDTRHW